MKKAGKLKAEFVGSYFYNLKIIVKKFFFKHLKLHKVEKKVCKTKLMYNGRN